MDCINQIKTKLENYPGLEWQQDGQTIAVSPEHGFTVWLMESAEGCTVGFNGWHEEFADKAEALDCFGFGLSDKCRLQVFSKGASEYKWVLQAFENNQWVSYSTTALVFFPFWRKTRISYLQNHLAGGW